MSLGYSPLLAGTVNSHISSGGGGSNNSNPNAVNGDLPPMHPASSAVSDATILAAAAASHTTTTVNILSRNTNDTTSTNTAAAATNTISNNNNNNNNMNHNNSVMSQLVLHSSTIVQAMFTLEKELDEREKEKEGNDSPQANTNSQSKSGSRSKKEKKEKHHKGSNSKESDKETLLEYLLRKEVQEHEVGSTLQHFSSSSNVSTIHNTSSDSHPQTVHQDPNNNNNNVTVVYPSYPRIALLTTDSFYQHQRNNNTRSANYTIPDETNTNGDTLVQIFQHYYFPRHLFQDQNKCCADSVVDVNEEEEEARRRNDSRERELQKLFDFFIRFIEQCIMQSLQHYSSAHTHGDLPGHTNNPTNYISGSEVCDGPIPVPVGAAPHSNHSNSNINNHKDNHHLHPATGPMPDTHHRSDIAGALFPADVNEAARLAVEVLHFLLSLSYTSPCTCLSAAVQLVIAACVTRHVHQQWKHYIPNQNIHNHVQGGEVEEGKREAAQSQTQPSSFNQNGSQGCSKIKEEVLLQQVYKDIPFLELLPLFSKKTLLSNVLSPLHLSDSSHNSMNHHAHQNENNKNSNHNFFGQVRANDSILFFSPSQTSNATDCFVMSFSEWQQTANHNANINDNNSTSNTNEEGKLNESGYALLGPLPSTSSLSSIDRFLLEEFYGRRDGDRLRHALRLAQREAHQYWSVPLTISPLLQGYQTIHSYYNNDITASTAATHPAISPNSNTSSTVQKSHLNSPSSLGTGTHPSAATNTNSNTILLRSQHESQLHEMSSSGSRLTISNVISHPNRAPRPQHRPLVDLHGGGLIPHMNASTPATASTVTGASSNASRPTISTPQQQRRHALLCAVGECKLYLERPLRRRAQELLYHIFADLGESPLYYSVLSLYPSMLSAHHTAMQFLFFGEGPLPIEERLLLAMMAASRHRCEYLLCRFAAILERYLNQLGETSWEPRRVESAHGSSNGNGGRPSHTGKRNSEHHHTRLNDTTANEQAGAGGATAAIPIQRSHGSTNGLNTLSGHVDKDSCSYSETDSFSSEEDDLFNVNTVVNTLGLDYGDVGGGYATNNNNNAATVAGLNHTEAGNPAATTNAMTSTLIGEKAFNTVPSTAATSKNNNNNNFTNTNTSSNTTSYAASMDDIPRHMWLTRGPPARLRAVRRLIAFATHTPWAVDEAEIKQILRAGWSIPELYQLMALLAEVVPLTSFIAGLCVPTEPWTAVVLPPQWGENLPHAASSADLQLTNAVLPVPAAATVTEEHTATPERAQRRRRQNKSSLDMICLAPASPEEEKLMGSSTAAEGERHLITTYRSGDTIQSVTESIKKRDLSSLTTRKVWRKEEDVFLRFCGEDSVVSEQRIRSGNTNTTHHHIHPNTNLMNAVTTNSNVNTSTGNAAAANATGNHHATMTTSATLGSNNNNLRSLWRRDFSWSETGALSMEQYYPSAAALLTEELAAYADVARQVQDNNCIGLKGQGDISASYALHSLSVYVQNLIGFMQEDYPYNDINKILRRPAKWFAQVLTLRPETLSRADIMHWYTSPSTSLQTGAPSAVHSNTTNTNTTTNTTTHTGSGETFESHLLKKEIELLTEIKPSLVTVPRTYTSQGLSREGETPLAEAQPQQLVEAKLDEVLQGALALQDDSVLLLIAVTVMAARKEGLLHLLLHPISNILSNM